MLTRRASGFTIIELMIGVALLGVLLALALPSFTLMLHNMKLRNAAEGLSHGLQAARSTALQRNLPVEFLLTDDDPVEANVAGPNITTSGPNFMIRAQTAPGAYSFVEGRSGAEGQGQAEATALHVTAAAVVSARAGFTADAVTFNSLGRAELTSNATFLVSNPAGGACKTAAGDEPMRCLTVVVTPGGQIRMCDQSIADKSDSRAC